MFTLGGLTLLLWFTRFFVFRFHESPRYLIGKGRDQEAVEVIHKIAKFNGKADRCTITVEDLQKAAVEESSTSPTQDMGTEANNSEMKRTVLSRGSHFSGSHIKALFATRKMAWSTTLLVVIWGTIGLASTLYNSFLPYMRVLPLVFAGLT